MFRKGLQSAAKKCCEYRVAYNMAKSTTKKGIKSTVRVIDNKVSNGLNKMTSRNTLMKISKCEMQKAAVASLSVLGAHVLTVMTGLNALAVAEEDDDGGGT